MAGNVLAETFSRSVPTIDPPPPPTQRGAPTTRIQHKHNQTTDLCGEIQEVHSRPAKATGRPNFAGKAEKGVDRKLSGWRNTNVPPGPDRVYLLQVVAGCVWVPEERIWAPEVFIMGEGIHFIVDHPVRLMAQPKCANIIVAELGILGTRNKENVWTSTQTTTTGGRSSHTTHHNNHTGARRGGEG